MKFTARLDEVSERRRSTLERTIGIMIVTIGVSDIGLSFNVSLHIC